MLGKIVTLKLSARIDNLIQCHMQSEIVQINSLNSFVFTLVLFCIDIGLMCLHV